MVGVHKAMRRWNSHENSHMHGRGSANAARHQLCCCCSGTISHSRSVHLTQLAPSGVGVLGPHNGSLRSHAGGSTGRKCRPSREFRPKPRHLMEVTRAPSFTQAGLSPQNAYLMDQAPHLGPLPRF